MPQSNIIVGNKLFENVSKFNYLWVLMTKAKTSYEYIREYIQEMTVVIQFKTLTSPVF
jgi:hypothetical protein